MAQAVSSDASSQLPSPRPWVLAGGMVVIAAQLVVLGLVVERHARAASASAAAYVPDTLQPPAETVVSAAN